MEFAYKMDGMIIKSPKGETFDMPAWQDCGWRRITCEKESCPMCGRQKKHRQKCLNRGLDPDSMEAAMDCVQETFSEVGDMLRTDAARFGVDLNNLEDVKETEPPSMESYQICAKVMKWRDAVYNLFGEAESWGDGWQNSEAGQDLSWYANLLPVKLYRALCAKWEMKNDDRGAWVDYIYTKYAVEEILKIIKNSLVSLRGELNCRQMNFMFLQSELAEVAKDIEKELG